MRIKPIKLYNKCTAASKSRLAVFFLVLFSTFLLNVTLVQNLRNFVFAEELVELVRTMSEEEHKHLTANFNNIKCPVYNLSGRLSSAINEIDFTTIHNMDVPTPPPELA